MLCKEQPDQTKYVLEEMAQEMGHQMLFLPVRHCELNPIELCWAKGKGYVAKKNTTFKMKDVKRLMWEGLEKVDADYWKKCIGHVRKIEQDYWKADNIQDENDAVVININDDSSDESMDEGL